MALFDTVQHVSTDWNRTQQFSKDHIVSKEQHLQILVEAEVRTGASNSGSSTNHRADVVEASNSGLSTNHRADGAADMRQHWRWKNKFEAQTACHKLASAAVDQSLPSLQSLVDVDRRQSSIGTRPALHQQAVQWNVLG